MSLEGLALLLLAVLALLGMALWRSLQAQRLLASFEQSLHRAEVTGKEQAARLEALEALRDTQQLTEHAIATGTAVVKEMHKGIADIPFSVFEAIPATRAPAKALRGLHDSISEGVYGALAGLNKAVGRELRKGVPLADAPEKITPQSLKDASAPAMEPDSPTISSDEKEPPSPSSKGWG